jgi:hypothetical protein
MPFPRRKIHATSATTMLKNAQHKQNATRKVWKNCAQGIQKHLTTAELSISFNSD